MASRDYLTKTSSPSKRRDEPNARRPRKKRVRRVPFEEVLRVLRAYARKHGNADVPTSCVFSGLLLGRWVSWRRTQYANGRMPRAKARALEAIPGWRWRSARCPQKPQKFSERLRSLRDYIKVHGHSNVPVKYKGPRRSGALGIWVSTRRMLYRAGDLPRQQVKALASIRGWEWRTNRRSRPFDEVLQILRAYADAHGHVDAPGQYRQPRTGYGLGAWLRHRRMRYHAGRMPKSQVKALESLPGWTWTTGTFRRIHDLLRALSVYAKKHGHTEVPRNDRGLDGQVRWIRRQYPQQLTREQIRAFEALPGWSWVQRSVSSNSFMKGLEQLRAYSKEHGHTRLPSNYWRGGRHLQAWAAQQRQLCRRGKLAPERRRLLEAVQGWEWNPTAARRARFDPRRALRAYIDAHGHANVPASYRQPRTGFRLGQWVSGARYRYKIGRMSESLAKALESLPGWTWRAGVEMLLRALAVYAKKHGHTRVPATYRIARSYKLGERLTAVRMRYRSQLTKEQIRAFERLPGWSWRRSRGREASLPTQRRRGVRTTSSSTSRPRAEATSPIGRA
jgi:Helicase associated domain